MAWRRPASGSCAAPMAASSDQVSMRGSCRWPVSGRQRNEAAGTGMIAWIAGTGTRYRRASRQVRGVGCRGGSEEPERGVVGAAHQVVVQGDAADTAVLGQHPGLRLDLLRGKHAAHRRQQRVAVQQFQIPGELLARQAAGRC